MGAGVQGTFDQQRVIGPDADDRCDAGEIDDPDQTGHLTDTDRGVFHVDTQPVEPGTGHNLAGFFRCEADPGADRRNSVRQIAF